MNIRAYLLLSLTAIVAVAQPKPRYLDKETFFQMETVTAPDIAPDGAQLAKPAVIVDRLVWGRDGVGPVAKGYAHVFTIDTTLGGTPRQITQGNYAHSPAEWSPDGASIYVSSIRKPDAEYLKGDSEI